MPTCQKASSIQNNGTYCGVQMYRISQRKLSFNRLLITMAAGYTALVMTIDIISILIKPPCLSKDEGILKAACDKSNTTNTVKYPQNNNTISRQVCLKRSVFAVRLNGASRHQTILFWDGSHYGAGPTQTGPCHQGISEKAIIKVKQKYTEGKMSYMI